MAHIIVLREEGARWGLSVTDAMFRIFQDYLKVSSNLSAADAAREVDRLVPKKQGELRVGCFLTSIWFDFIAIAEQIPYDHPYGQSRLVDVLRELILLPDTGIRVKELKDREVLSRLTQLFVPLAAKYY
jgi:hypothetical protein